MDESLARGLVLGAALGLVGFVAYVVKRLMASKSEGARRFKVVLAVLAALGITIVVGSAFGAVALVLAMIGTGAMVWVYKGYKK